MLRAALNQALRWELVSRNDAALTDPPCYRAREIQPLSPDQAKILLAAVAGHRRQALICVGLGLGLRLGEALGLRWESVDLDSGVLSVRQTLERSGGDAAERKRLNTKRRQLLVKVQLGPQLVAWAVILNKQLGLSFGKVATLLRQPYGITVSRSGLVRAVDRASRHAQPTYAALQHQVRNSPVVTPDETGWKVAGRLNWLWVVATPQTTVYQIQPGRGYAEAANLLGKDFAGVIVRDGWAPYRRFTAATHQSCLAHLLRRAKTLRTDHPHSLIVVQIQTALQQALRLRDAVRAGTCSPARLDHALDALGARLAERVLHPGPLADVQRFANHLRTEWTALFSFLRNPAIDATNWRAEQAIRPAVVTRKICGGNRSWRGADAQHILTSLIRTATQRQLDPQRRDRRPPAHPRPHRRT